MFIWTWRFDRKKVAFCVVVAALLIIGIILLLGAHSHAVSAAPRAGTVRSEKARVAYLADCGWEVDSPAIKEETLVIPRSFSAVFEKYNELQKQQGFDLSRHCGEEVTVYTYRVRGCPGENVVACLYVRDGTVIGGDVHSTALDGFMCGLKQDKKR